MELFNIYTWIFNLYYMLLELFPLRMRALLLRPLFGKLGKGVRLIDYKTYFRYPHKIEIGSYVSINRGCFFAASMSSGRKRDIIIGDHVVFAPNVRLLSAGHDYSEYSLPDTSGQIVIGDYAWIGEGAVILQDVTVGEGAVIGAGSVVTKDIPPYTVWAGNPARQIGPRNMTEGPGGSSFGKKVEDK